MIQNVDLSKQYKSISTKIKKAIERVLKSGWFVLGKEVELFEAEFARYTGTKYSVGVGSGTDAIHLSLRALGIGIGDEVITVSNTAVFTVSAIELSGAKAVFADIEPNYYTIDSKTIEKLITKRTKAIVPVHLYGQCADMDAICKIAKKHKLYVIEDACQSHGAVYNGKKAGSMGDMGCFSFYPSKNLGTYGDGGIITTNNRALYKTLKMLRHGGQSKRYVHDVKGMNSRLDEIHAAILREKLKYIDKWNGMRIKNAEIYDRYISNSRIIKPRIRKNSLHVYHLYVIRTQNRAKFMRYLKSKGIQSFIHYPIPIHHQKAYKEYFHLRGKLPETESVMKEIVSLPMYPELKKKDILYISRMINKHR